MFKKILYLLSTYCFAATLDDEIKTFLDNNHMNATYKVVDVNGKILASGTHEKNPQALQPNRYLILSVTKHISAYVTLKTIENNKLKLNNKIIDILTPSHYIWQNETPPEWAYNTTIHELLTHKSGIQEYLYDAILDGIDLSSEKQAKIETIKIARNKLQKQKKYYYCNSNYFLIGLILEEIYQDNILNIFNNIIFKPAGIQNTRFVTIDEMLTDNNGEFVPVRTVVKDKTKDLNLQGMVFLSMLTKLDSDKDVDTFKAPNLSIFAFAEGGLHSNTDDMIKLLQYFYKQDLYNSDLGKKMFDPVDTRMYYVNDRKVHKNSGMGTHIINSNMYGHTGDAAGMTSEVFFLKKQEVFVVIFSNQEVLKEAYTKDKHNLPKYEITYLLYHIEKSIPIKQTKNT